LMTLPAAGQAVHSRTPDSRAAHHRATAITRVNR
jgi:hypothetical protein